MLLQEARAKAVAAYRAHPGSWPDGIGAWYRPEDWGPEKDGKAELIALGEARVRALDPWANDRAKGRPCPPLSGLEQSNKTESNSPLSNTEIAKLARDGAFDKKAYQREYMRSQRAKEKGP